MELTAINIDAMTGEITERPLTAEEIAERENYAAQQAILDAELAELQAEKERIAATLGLTLDELKVLLS